VKVSTLSFIGRRGYEHHALLRRALEGHSTQPAKVSMRRTTSPSCDAVSDALEAMSVHRRSRRVLARPAARESTRGGRGTERRRSASTLLAIQIQFASLRSGLLLSSIASPDLGWVAPALPLAQTLHHHHMPRGDLFPVVHRAHRGPAQRLVTDSRDAASGTHRGGGEPEGGSGKEQAKAPSHASTTCSSRQP